MTWTRQTEIRTENGVSGVLWWEIREPWFHYEAETEASARILRLFLADEQGTLFRLGIPEPNNGKLRLQKKLRLETLQNEGLCIGERLYAIMAASPEDAAALLRQEEAVPCIDSWEPVLRAIVLRSKGLRVVQESQGWCVRERFIPGKALTLAPLALLLTQDQDELCLQMNAEGWPVIL